jgi:hypothetical protein
MTSQNGTKPIDAKLSKAIEWIALHPGSLGVISTDNAENED